MSSEANTAAPAGADPYREAPAYWQTHPVRVQALAVAVLTVLLAVASFPPGTMPEFAYAMLVPGIFWAYLRPAFRVYALTILGSQAVAWTILLSWLSEVSWVGLLILGPFTGVWIGLWYLLAWWTMPRMVGRPTPVRLAAMLGLCGAWVLIEWTRTWFLGGFPWLPLSASQWQRPSVLQVAAYTGAWGVSFVLVAVNIGFTAYAHRLFREGEKGLRRRSQEFFLALFLLLVCLSFLVQDTHDRGRYTEPLFQVSFVQPNIPQNEKWDPARAPAIREVLERGTEAASLAQPDLVLWPEAVLPLAVRGDAGARAWVEEVSRRIGSPLLLGSIATEPGPDGEVLYQNGAFVVEPINGLQPRFYAKRRLVPFGEYIPLEGLLGWLRKVVPIGENFTPGDDPVPIVLTAGGRPIAVTALICFEDTYPGLARDSAAFGGQVLVVLTNDGWFGERGAAYQHAAHSVLRAVETRRPVLRIGNAGWSGWIDEFGIIRYTALDDRESVYFRGTRTANISRDLRWVNQESLYVRRGDWFVGASAGLCLFGFMLLKTGGAGRRQDSAAPETDVS
jgi:apolipoprotein N-acyltransferase